jgi:hypothetical protein
MRSSLVTYLAIIGAGIATPGCGNLVLSPAADALGNPAADLIESAPKAPRDLRSGMQGYYGTVSAVGADWVELAPGWNAAGPDIKPGDNTKVKHISAAGTKPGGDPEGPPFLIDTHLLTDLKVGDVVSVYVGVLRDGREWATELHIERRPGGKIPLMPPDRFGGHTSLVAQNQAEQDWEEKGIPIPAKFLDPQGRAPWTKPPYPPVAPLPRPAKP